MVAVRPQKNKRTTSQGVSNARDIKGEQDATLQNVARGLRMCSSVQLECKLSKQGQQDAQS